MATNWDAILSNTNNLQDVLSILKKVLASLDIKADITTIDEALTLINSLDADVQEKLSDVTAAITKFNNTGGFISAPTLDALLAITPEYDYQVARVDATGDEYRWNIDALPEPTWEPTGRNFLDDSKNYTDQKVLQLEPVTLSPESGYVWALRDPISKKAPIRCRVDGGFEIDSIYLSDKSISYSYLDDEVTGLIPTKLNPESGYVWGLKDPVSKKTPVRVKVDGTLEADNFTLGSNSVSVGSLKADVKRAAVPQKTDLIQSEIDNCRATKSNIGLKTQGAGYWNQLPSIKTKLLFGTNNTGTAIDVRKTINLPILGKTYAGEWSFNTAVQSRNLRGVLNWYFIDPIVGTYAAGDYFQYVAGSGQTSEGAYPGLNVGDLLVFDGSNWVIQRAPATFTTRYQNGYFWKSTSAGWFDGVQYSVGDLIMYVTRQTGGGGDQYERWYKLNPEKGDLGFIGPVDSLPASPIKSGVYELNSTKNYHVYDGSNWVEFSNNNAVTVAAGASFNFPCIENANEYEVRRTDKSASSVGFLANCYTQSNVRRSTDELILMSDSMFGVNETGQKVLDISGRSGAWFSYGGSTSNQVLGMAEYKVLTGDLNKGKTFIFWHGQNNQPYDDINAALIRECSLKMQQIVGAISPRVAFLSILGQRNASWDSGLERYVVSQHENQKAKTGSLWALQDWYNKTFPNRHISPYNILIAAADDTPDPTFPGMTEKQVAQTYGIVPYSFFNNSYPSSWSADDLNYLGTWSAASLPTITANQFDYYLRIASGNGFNFLIVYVNGAWVQYDLDITHLSQKGANALALGINNFLNNKLF
ncbi:hypothetical protein [uncultured Acinetobacter sp.]|uniref:hypothetical protein n=1 Tax=uncultured Acinetobacter sp. TaxID=165433 RepID=UPI0025870F1B|nr:hypothetical protein [uncultured Acinetobacter sp.]